MQRLTSETIDDAIRHLKQRDKVLGNVIKHWGPARIRLRRGRFDMLVRSILSQQISGAAARTIQKRLAERIGAFRPEAICELDIDSLREAGVSRQKAGYLLDLAEHAVSNRIRFHRHSRMSDDEIIEDLIQVRGVGRWTAQMYLIFSLGRPNVFPEDDLGVRSAIRNLYGFNELPTREESRTVAQKWEPYCSVASWYCWRSLESEA